MISRKVFWALPFSISSVLAAPAVIPPGEIVLKSLELNSSALIFKDAKGTLLSPIAITGLPENWFNLSPADGAEGVRSEETYVTYGLPKSDDVIVAVVDSGVDVNHEDLQGKIWINPGETPNNGIDDDKNGYVDDVFGWNFLGGADGMAQVVSDPTLKNGVRLVKGKTEAQVNQEQLEVTREFVRMKKLKTELEELGESLSEAQTTYLASVQKQVEDGVAQAKQVVTTYSARLDMYKKAEATLQTAGVPAMTLEAVRAVNSTDPAVLQAKKDMITLLSNNLTEARLNAILGSYGSKLNYHFNVDFNPRTRVGDNLADQTEKNYGNNDVTGPDAHHGTHVSGIIAAIRDNNLGIKGVATNVKIMAVRVVPNGDERDKDVANGIRYAVDNGAKIINMSFGKTLSPFKKVVDDAFKYAESKGVLVVHAAGNDSRDIDHAPNFPGRITKAGYEFTNWLEIGASSYQKGATLPATFSNFGKKTVDFFAPGVNILSTTPDNKYDTYSGTSMATPAAVGVAALVLSYNPTLNIDGLKELLIDTSRRFPGLQVNLPGGETKTLFSNLSTYGSVIDAFEAVKATK